NADGTGQAAFTMSVEGGQASGQYVVVLARQSGQWRITSAIVRLSGGEVVTLVGEGTRDGGATPGPAAGVGDEGAPPAPPAPPGVGPPPKPRAGVISAGVLDGKAIRKPAAAYPAVAKAARASGTVTVQVTANEQGDVIEARAVSGHPLLRAAAEAAARQAKLSPTLVSGKPVKVSGVLTYEFKPE
ncbi:MAG TPA: TonB family protein, partial [Pyrinomonadaceae bacterium]|nr:TonB family protein [Pyrinomonadaceae bacterium]